MTVDEVTLDRPQVGTRHLSVLSVETLPARLEIRMAWQEPLAFPISCEHS